MKKVKYFMALLTMVVLFCVTGNAKVNATYQEEIEQIEQNETKLSKFFDKEFVGYALEFVVAFGATVAALTTFIKTLKGTQNDAAKSVEKSEETKKEIVNTQETILANNESTQKAIEENNKATQLAIAEDNAKTREQLETLKEVIILAFSNDDKLVKKGVAEQIVNKLGSDSNGKTN